MKSVDQLSKGTWQQISFAFVLLLFIGSCQCGNSQNEHDVPVVEVNANSSNIFSVDSIATLSHLVALETSGESLIGSIDKLFVTRDRIFILDQKRDNLLSFSLSGSFLGQVCRKGNGPQEYVSLDDVSLDADSGRLYLWDRIKSNLLVYSTEGELIEVRHSNFDGNSLTVNGNRVYIYYSYNNNPKKFDIISVDSDLQNMHEGFLPRKNISLPSMIKPCFIEENGSRYFCSIYSNSLFQIDENGVKPYMELDFGDKKVPYDQLLNLNSGNIGEIIGTNTRLGHVSGMHVSKTLCFFSFDEIIGDAYGKHFLGIINLKDNSVQTFGPVASSPLLIDQGNLLHITEDQQLVYAIYPDRFNPIYYDELRKYCPGVTSEDNPILAFYNLKQWKEEN